MWRTIRVRISLSGSGPLSAPIFSDSWSGFVVAGMAQVTAGWEMTHQEKLRPVRRADLLCEVWQRVAFDNLEKFCFFERHVNHYRHALVGRRREDALLGVAGVNRVVHLNKIQIAFLDPVRKRPEIRQLMVGDTYVAHDSFLLPAAKDGNDLIDVHKAVNLHHVDLVPPQALHRLFKTGERMAVVGEEFARRPDLVGDEQLAGDAHRGGEVADADLAGAIHGDVSTTRPPPSRNRRMTSRMKSRGSPGITSNVREVPRPMAGSDSFVRGMVFVMMPCVREAPAETSAAPA